MFSTLLALLGLAATPALAISLGLLLPDQNVWTQLTYTITVPPPPPPPVISGPWFFWAGFELPVGGVLQPVLQWGEDPADGWVNSDVTFPKEWFMVLWTVCDQDKNNDQSAISQGVYAAQGAQILNTVTYDNNGYWTQTAEVISGGGAGASVTQTISAAQYFDTANMPASGANAFVIESELTGGQTGDWDFDVEFTDISITAMTNDGVSMACGEVNSRSDGNGFITVNGYSLSSDGLTCHWDSMTLSPP
ncbi:hypothetical protein DACRYDRAFT_17806 [Dacryopinax primogenitus]|uniref:Concanavalin A-like lectin/glucanase n=1 Tax=Dacryopinax primogenitus (strain DJM 731) TaxID=1858805 RepID=M5FPI4_DACPD|nr:uncharacterized protein DACRYDRAFT_17806 [Dacryopinax primogenitus]EJT98590.1 hypothetical protein DACRYDRAFT_17806 [Dacryopinax primogenitus]